MLTHIGRIEVHAEQHSSVIADQIPEEVTREVLGGIDIICESLWQNASASVRRRYQRFARTPMEFAMRYQLQEMFPEQYPSVEEAMCVLDDIVSIGEIGAVHDLVSARSAGRVLQFASFGGCMLGGKASYGDLYRCLSVAHMAPVHQKDPEYYGNVFQSFLNRDYRSVSIYLNACLEYSVDMLNDLKANDERFPVFYYEEEEDVWLPDLSVIGSGYYFYRSLLEYTEPPAGSA